MKIAWRVLLAGVVSNLVSGLAVAGAGFSDGPTLLGRRLESAGASGSTPASPRVRGDLRAECRAISHRVLSLFRQLVHDMNRPRGIGAPLAGSPEEKDPYLERPRTLADDDIWRLQPGPHRAVERLIRDLRNPAGPYRRLIALGLTEPIAAALDPLVSPDGLARGQGVPGSTGLELAFGKAHQSLEAAATSALRLLGAAEADAP